MGMPVTWYDCMLTVNLVSIKKLAFRSKTQVTRGLIAAAATVPDGKADPKGAVDSAEIPVQIATSPT